jgi:hypothetical protein
VSKFVFGDEVVLMRFDSKANKFYFFFGEVGDSGFCWVQGEV